ncbi:archaemetzincin family Zn-dependent metalloprotease [Bacteroidota bacterium]
MIKQYITLLNSGNFEQQFLEEIVETITDEFRIQIKIIETRMDLSKFYDPSRKQYNGNKLLEEVSSRIKRNSLKTIGLFRVDIFIPILTYIFGQAYLNGESGIASTYRLKNEYYGLKSDELLLQDRFSKEIIHELGHTFGLKHCHVPACVMVSSTYVEDIDQKSASFCIKCKNEMNLL